MRFGIYLLLFVSVYAFSFAQEEEEPAIPKPAELKTNWWDYFDTSPAQLPEKTEEFSTSIENMLDKLSPENREKAQVLVGKAISNLQALAHLSSQPLPQIPAAPTLKNSYSVAEVLELHRTIRRIDIELDTQRADRTDQLQQIAIQEEHLAVVLEQYNTSEKRSEEEFILGLEVIAYRTSIELAKKRLVYLNRSIEEDQTTEEHLREELTYARAHISVAPEKSTLLKQKISDATTEWETTKEDVRKKEIEAAIAVPGADDKLNEANEHLLKQQFKRAQIDEILAHNYMLQLQIVDALIDVIATPSQVNVTLLDQETQKWEKQLQTFQNKSALWMTQIERQLQTTSQILSLDTQDKEAVSPTLTLVQQQIIRTANNNLQSLQQLKNEVEDSQFLLSELEAHLTQLFVGSEWWLREIYQLITQSTKQAFESTSSTLFQVGTTRVTAFTIIRFFIILFVTWWIARLSAKAFTTLRKRRRGISKSLVYRISRLFRYFIIAVGLIVAFWSLGFDFSYFFLIAGALGVGLGFGLQSIFNNFISGLIILFESYLKVGDFIEIEEGNLRGEVRAINVRSIIIRTNDGIDVLIPNSEVIGGRLINWTLKDPYRREHIPFNVAYGSDKELIEKVVVEAARKVEFTLDRPNTPSPQVRFLKFGDSSLEFELAVWVNEKASRRSRATRSAYLFAIDDALRAHKITVPFPQRDIHIIEN